MMITSLNGYCWIGSTLTHCGALADVIMRKCSKVSIGKSFTKNMNSNSPASPYLDPTFVQQQHQHQQQRQQRQQQNNQCSLPLIPYDLVQPLRDALPKIDEALLSTVPLEALPLCQQLFNAWISTNVAADANIAPPSRAKTTTNISSLCQSSSSSSSLSKHQHTTQSTVPKQCRKSQSTSRLSSWFSWSIPKRKNPSVAPIVLERKKSTNQNISDAISVHAKTTNSSDPPISNSISASQIQQKYQLPSSYDRQKPYHSRHIHISQQPQRPQEIHTQQHHPHDQVKRMASWRSHPSHQQKIQPSRQLLKQSSSSLLESSSSSSSSSMSTSTSASMLSKTNQKQNDGNSTSYRRSISFMLSKIGTKVRKVIQSGGQRIHPQLKSVNSSITMSLTNTSQNNLLDPRRLLLSSSTSSSSRHMYSKKIQTSTDHPLAPLQKIESNDTTAAEIHQMTSMAENSTKQLSLTDDESAQSTSCKDNRTTYFASTNHSSQQYFNAQETPSDGKNTRHDLDESPTTIQRLENTDTIIAESTKVPQPLFSSSPIIKERHLLFDATNQDTEDEDSYTGRRNLNICYNNDSSITTYATTTTTTTNNNNTYYVYDSQDDDDDDTTNLKTPWSPPESLARCAMKSSKTDTNMKNEPSVPFIKMGLGRKSLDVEDQLQYTTRSMSSTSFALQWQEKFHNQQLPRDRIVDTLKSVSLSLYNIIQHNHAYQQFTSDTTYVAHPNLLPGENARQLFATVPLAHWRDIFDQMAYIFDNGVLTAEHAIITLIYIERMLSSSKQHLCEANWRLIVLAGLMMAVKVWDDCAVYNMDFVQIFPELDIKHINLIERRFLEHINWDVSVRCSLFASTYFDLRSHIKI